MLPAKIRNRLIDEFGERFYQFSKSSIIEYLTDFDTEDNIERAMMTSSGDITKIIFRKPDGKIDTTFTNIKDSRKLISSIRSDGSLNYHDYLTIFKIINDHPIYDLIVNVNYRYVYS